MDPPSPHQTPIHLTTLPNEITISNLDMPSLTTLSSTCTTLHTLTTTNPACQHAKKTAFSTLEATAPTKYHKYVLIPGWEHRYPHDASRGRERRPSAVAHRESKIAAALVGVRDGFLACYGCYRFKRKEMLLRELQCGRFTIKGCLHMYRICIDCVLDENGLQELALVKPRLACPLPVQWESGRFAQEMPKMFQGWGLAECSGCERISWSLNMPTAAQRTRKLCNGCFKDSVKSTGRIPSGLDVSQQ